MQLVTYSSPSHLDMCERFVIANGKQAGFSACQLFEDTQICENGGYTDLGFADQTWRKLECLTKIPIGTNVCFLDADCLPLPGFASFCGSLITHDNVIHYGWDADQFCTGVMVFRQTELTVNWFRFVKQFAWMCGIHDQSSLNTLAVNCKHFPVGMSKIDNTIVANWATTANLEASRVWDGSNFVIPDSTLCWHANFCIGVDKKMAMLEIVERKMLDKIKQSAIN